MCRLIVYAGEQAVSLSDLLLNPSHSIMKQSYSCKERFGDGLSGLPSAINADGFGIGWYAAPAVTPCSATSYGSAGGARVPGVAAIAREASASTRTPADAGSLLAHDAAHVNFEQQPAGRAHVYVAASTTPASDASGSALSHAGALPAAGAELAPADKPAVYASVSPAWNDSNLPRICDKLQSHLVFGHIRAASIGSGVHIMNCHPFAHGRYMWMHNGHVGGFARLRRRILLHLSDRALACIRGTTDSEHMFAVFVTEVEALERVAHERLSPELLQQALLSTFNLIALWRQEAGIADSSLLNVCVTDGATVIATRLVLGEGRAASLYFTTGSGWAPRTPGAADAVDTTSRRDVEYAMKQADKREQTIIIASERLTGCNADWLEVPKDCMLIVHPSHAILRHKVHVQPASAVARSQTRLGSLAAPIPASPASSSTSSLQLPSASRPLLGAITAPHDGVVKPRALMSTGSPTTTTDSVGSSLSPVTQDEDDVSHAAVAEYRSPLLQAGGSDGEGGGGHNASGEHEQRRAHMATARAAQAGTSRLHIHVAAGTRGIYVHGGAAVQPAARANVVPARGAGRGVASRELPVVGSKRSRLHDVHELLDETGEHHRRHGSWLNFQEIAGGVDAGEPAFSSDCVTYSGVDDAAVAPASPGLRPQMTCTGRPIITVPMQTCDIGLCVSSSSNLGSLLAVDGRPAAQLPTFFLPPAPPLRL